MDKQLNNACDIHLSVVSHGQWPMILQLLNDLAQLSCCSRFQLTITFNINESYELNSSQYPFAITVIENSSVKGFGANHNAAFYKPPDGSKRKYFVVINPDIRIFEDVFSELTKTIDLNWDSCAEKTQKIGVITPAIKNLAGHLEDSARELPTPGKIIAKLFGQRKRWQYSVDQSYQPDWIAGMFMLFKVEVYELIGGFDDSFFLYYEDVELCSRLWLEGYTVVVESDVNVVHNAQRTSHRNLTYMRWHLGSMLHFFLSDTYRRVKMFHNKRI